MTLLRIIVDNACKVLQEVVPATVSGAVRKRNITAIPHLLNATANQETVTGDPTISKITKIVCCQAVSELRSNVIKPVPVAALTQRNNESTKLMWNIPLEAQNTTAHNSGIKRLQDKRAIGLLGGAGRHDETVSLTSKGCGL